MNMRWVTVNVPRTYVGPYHNLKDANTTPTSIISWIRIKALLQKNSGRKDRGVLNAIRKDSKADYFQKNVR
jgi:hypothetical protein